jgi:hypothetical protein
MKLFGSGESKMKKLFDMIKSHLLVVVYDQSSQSLEPDSTMMKFLQLLKKDSVDASLLSGGYTGFTQFITDGGYNARDFIEIGLGESSTAPSTPHAIPNSIVSSPAPKNIHPKSPTRTSSGPLNSIPQQRPNSGSSLVRSAYQVGLGAKGGKVRDAVKNYDSPSISPTSPISSGDRSRNPSSQRAPLQDRNNDGITRNVSDYVSIDCINPIGFESWKDACFSTNCP